MGINCIIAKTALCPLSSYHQFAAKDNCLYPGDDLSQGSSSSLVSGVSVSRSLHEVIISSAGYLGFMAWLAFEFFFFFFDFL